MRCTKCGTDNREGRKFCASCGSPLAIACSKCGASNLAGEQFCGECGAPLTAADSSRAPQTAPADAAITGERRHLTILFCDLVGSTKLTARLDPEEWRAALVGYHRAAAEEIARFDGHVAKYLGDGVMALFGYPEAHENDAERAVRAALTILDALTKLEAPVKLSARVGIDSGPVVVGTGAGQAVDAFGDAANIAARVQAIAEADTVVVTGETHRLISGLFEVEDYGQHPLKGVERTIQLYRVVRPSGIRGRFEAAAAAGRLTRFVGREDELRSLLSRWARARDGEGQVVTISGEAGIGKSRLVRRFREEIAASPHLWLQAGAGAFFQSTPFYPVTELLRQLTDSGSAVDPITQLESALRAVRLNPAETIPLLAPLLNLPPSPEYPASQMSPEQQRRRLLAMLVEWLLRAARDRPLVVVIEDLHWIDPSTLELIQLLVDQGATVPLLLFYTARPEFRPPWPQRGHHLHLTLDRLSSQDVRAIVGAVAADHALADETIATLVERTAGVPLFVEELTRAVLERGNVGSGASAIPATLHDSLMARLDRLGGAKEALQVGAVLGNEFSYQLLRAVYPVAEQKLQEGLRSLTEAELLYVRGLPPDANYQFKHALIRDAAYEALLKSRRKELHLTVARCIDTEFPALRETHPEVLAHHWTESGESEPAIAAWRDAGETALRREANREAVQHYHAAIGLLPSSIDDVRRCTLLLGLGRAQHRAGDAIRAHDTLRLSGEIAARLGSPEMVSDAALEMEGLTFRFGLPGDAAVELLERALAMVERTDSTLRARILSGLSTVLGVTGQKEKAINLGEQGIAMSRRLVDTDTLISGLIAVAYCLQEPHDLDRRLGCLKEGLELATSQSEPQIFEVVDQLSDLQSLFSKSLLEAGDLARADAEFEAWTKIGDTRERPFHQWIIAGRGAERALMHGDFEQSEKLAHTALTLGQQIRADNVAAGLFGLQMFALERERGRLKELEPLVRLFLQQNSAAETWRPGLAVIYSELGRREEARAEFEQLAAHNFEDVRRDGLWMGTMTFLTDVCVFLGDQSRGAVLYDLLSRFDGRNVIIGYEVICYGALSRYLGALAATLERWDNAVRHFEDAVAMNAQMEARTWLAHTQFQYAKMLLARGLAIDHERAFALLDSALATTRRLGMRALEERVSALLNLQS